jgi:hypothetical protein
MNHSQLPPWLNPDGSGCIPASSEFSSCWVISPETLSYSEIEVKVKILVKVESVPNRRPCFIK